MEKIIVLGTGTGGAIESFNTCFVLEDSNREYFLVDTGGGNGVLRQLKHAGVDVHKIHNIFITHKHIDHSYGMLWIYRFIDLAMQKGKYEGNLNVYCHDEVAQILRNQIHTLLRKEQQKFLDKRIFINILHDREHFKVNSYDFEAIDIKAHSDKQFGFKITLNNGKKLVFTGDEPLREELQEEFKNYDWLLHEAFCLESEAEKYKPREKDHDTVMMASQKAEKLGIKNLILWYSQENLGEKRKEIYIAEAKENYTGNIYVPDDLDIIEL